LDFVTAARGAGEAPDKTTIEVLLKRPAPSSKEGQAL
jgi:hypothetical protein